MISHLKALDASGNQVSLLNEDSAFLTRPTPVLEDLTCTIVAATPYSAYPPSSFLSPDATGLVRSESWGWQNTITYQSPLVLMSPKDHAAPELLSQYRQRYSCPSGRSHGCDKTFSTSYHALRHSKLHTAEKSISCIHPSCKKKFTRADNMKQHLQTHDHTTERSIFCIHPGCEKKFTLAGNMKQHLQRCKLSTTMGGAASNDHVA